MLKILGALLVFISCTGIGFYEGLEKIKHEDTIKQLRQMVLLLKGEIQYGNSSLFLIFDQVSSKIQGMPGRLLKKMAEEMKKGNCTQFYSLFEECAKKDVMYHYLTKIEKQRFLEFGKYLGGTDRDTQIAQMNLYLQELELRLEELYKETKEKNKLCRTLGVMGGLFLVLILW